MLVRRGPVGTGLRVGSSNKSSSTTSEIDFVKPDEVELMDVSTKQIISVATSLIPFVEHDDAQRALMGANMQKQAVPLIMPEAPFVGTGMEARAALDSGDVLIAEGDGVVSSSRVTASSSSTTRTSPTATARRSARSSTTSTSSAVRTRTPRSTRSPSSSVARPSTAGDLLADGTSTSNGELALGKNLLVAYMPWEGYNYEDAIILNERLVRDDVLTSIHVKEYEIDARDTKLGAEEITRDIPNLPDDILADLDDRGIVRIGAEVEPGDILVGKVTPKGETEQSPEERLLRAIFGEKAREVRDTSLKVPHGESGKVIDVKVYSRDEDHEMQPGVNQLVKVYVAQKRKISEGDKLAGRHGNKGVISQDPARGGHALHGRRHARRHHLEPARRAEPNERRPGPREPPRLRGPSRLGGHRGQPGGRHLGSRRPDGPREASVPQDPSAHRAGRLRRDAVVRRRALGRDRAREGQADDPADLRDAQRRRANGKRLLAGDNDGKVTLYNGRTGEVYDNPISVGYAYILKLAHMVDDKIHARSTGPYSMITAAAARWQGAVRWSALR